MKNKIGGFLYRLAMISLHLVMLAWILYTLNFAGTMSMSTVGAHILGIAFYGALLIRFSAYLEYQKWKRGK